MGVKIGVGVRLYGERRGMWLYGRVRRGQCGYGAVTCMDAPAQDRSSGWCSLDHDAHAPLWRTPTLHSAIWWRRRRAQSASDHSADKK